MNDNDRRDKLVRSRAAHKGVATRYISRINDLIVIPMESIIDVQIMELQDVKSALQSKVDQIKSLNDQIELLIDDASLEAEISSASDNFETLNKAINSVNRRLQEIEKTRPISSSHRAPSNAFKLPKFELPDFNGNYLNWLSFWDFFNASVHNSDTLTPAQKLQYLKSSPKGDAAKLINHLPVIDGNYELARDSLVKRYANNRVIVRGHIDAILKHPDLKIESAKNIEGLQEGVTENVRALRNMGLPLEHWDTILVHIVTSKLDHESRKAWELAHPGTDLPTFNAMMEFLTRRSRALESSLELQSVLPNETKPSTESKQTSGYGKKSQMLENKASAGSHPSKESNQTRNQTLAYHGSSEKCPCCDNFHKLYGCSQFSALKLAERRNLIKEKKLCFNCLRPYHTSRELASQFVRNVVTSTIVYFTEKRLLLMQLQGHQQSP